MNDYQYIADYLGIKRFRLVRDSYLRSVFDNIRHGDTYYARILKDICNIMIVYATQHDRNGIQR